MTMEIELCPSLLSASTPAQIALSSPSQTIGSVVHVLCENQTIAVLRCMANRQWNGTLVEKCTSELTEESGGEFRVETVIIIVWVLGGVLLFALLVLLTVIVTSHQKHRHRSRRRSIFSTPSQSNRNSRYGDNPGFTTDSEAGFGGATLHRNSSHRSSLRPPSYHEAISGRLICMPGIATRVSGQSPVTSSAARDSCQSPRATPTNSRRESQNAPGVRTNGSDIRTSGAPVGACGGAPGNVRRYAYEYPSCFWEEEPPPPYSTITQYTPVTSVSAPVERPPPPARPQRSSAPLARLEYI
ncbi:uncharacterized protein LOC121372972 [Gigantopelta aegis]|uniref:uncharacterized protein LOC121372972 n=1 Tax=Gigantopelta aegis TaxID=1735272 RepID=UPI001B88DAAF|nr:uncharacterized protein LOC121372972 [Gigantopelta aegis]